jgi:quercetin dioxygenase-like cupin family protein
VIGGGHADGEDREVELQEGRSEADAAIRARFAGAVDAQRGTASSAVVFIELEPGWRGGRHTHSAEEVAFVYAGTAELVVGAESVRLSAGELAVVPALAPTT